MRSNGRSTDESPSENTSALNNHDFVRRAFKGGLPRPGAGHPAPVQAHDVPLAWLWATRTGARDTKMTPELDWCGQPIGPGGCYGGRPEHISPSWGKKPALAAAKHYEVITESDVGEVFGFGENTLTKAEAAKLLEELTGAHRTTCYRALRLKGRFGRRLHTDGGMLSWR